jgi:endonuclease/exonuclease/phosphatase family metal-dependent hydrolase
MVSAMLELPDGARLRIINAHLQSDDLLATVSVCRAVRDYQLGRIRTLLEGPTPAIVCGDFNIEAGSDEYRESLAPMIEQHRLHDPAHDLSLFTFDPQTNGMLRALDPTARPSRLDYVFTMPGAEASWRVHESPQLLLDRPLDITLPGERGRAFASDHYGLGVSLELVPGREDAAQAFDVPLAATG